MKAKSIDEAKELAKTKSLETEHKGEAIHIIYCNKTEYFYIATDGLVRLWEQSHGYYINGVYTAETKATEKTIPKRDRLRIARLSAEILSDFEWLENRFNKLRKKEYDRRKARMWRNEERLTELTDKYTKNQINECIDDENFIALNTAGDYGI